MKAPLHFQAVVATLLWHLVFVPSWGYGQTTRTTVVEHFTNTSCSVCAANNPGFMNAIRQSANTLHISFHPSSPYINDVFNVQNRVENDARTNHYGIFGATPRLVVNGQVIQNNTLSSALANAAGSTSAFALRLSTEMQAAGSYQLRVVLTKTAADTQSTARLFLGLVEDTVNQLTNNGEAVHYHVFRKAVSEITGNTITLPASVGDSVVLSYPLLFPVSQALQRWFVMGLLQQNNKMVLQAARSANLARLAASLEPKEVSVPVFFPNPIQNGRLFTSAAAADLQLFDALGRLVATRAQLHIGEAWDLSTLPAGIYRLAGRHNRQAFYQTLLFQP